MSTKSKKRDVLTEDVRARATIAVIAVVPPFWIALNASTSARLVIAAVVSAGLLSALWTDHAQLALLSRENERARQTIEEQRELIDMLQGDMNYTLSVAERQNELLWQKDRRSHDHGQRSRLRRGG